MQVVLAGALIERPGGAAEGRLQAGRHAAVGRRVAPHVEVAIPRVPCAARIDEPAMLVGGVVDHQVEQDADAARPGPRHQPVEVLQGPELGGDLLIVGDVVAVVVHRRGEDRRQPDDADAQRLQVVEPGNDAGDVAHAVAVAVGEAARIDLVHGGALPPFRLGCGQTRSPRLRRCGGRARMSGSRPPRRHGTTRCCRRSE